MASPRHDTDAIENPSPARSQDSRDASSAGGQGRSVDDKAETILPASSKSSKAQALPPSPSGSEATPLEPTAATPTSPATIDASGPSLHTDAIPGYRILELL